MNLINSSAMLQDGKALPSGPIVISPDGLFPSLFREGEIFYSESFDESLAFMKVRT